ncbi:MAG: carbohydrate ABC transporter permease [Caldilineaceae bacterium]|nr:carbohydrate ABC transporter permease [Caldilineaceae bacterium]MDE0430748.1 carbohydrate ABC transporter permease [Caldilineaceae bacterium]
MSDTSAIRQFSDSTDALRLKRRAQNLRIVGRISSHTVLLLCLAVVLTPFVWMLATSLKPEREAYLIPPQLFPSRFLWQNYYDALFKYYDFFLYTKNTLIITISVLVGRLLSASLVAFAFARLRFYGRDILFFIVLSTMMIPSQVTIIPLYIIFTKLKWIDTYLPLTVPAWFGGGAFFIFLLRQFMMTINPEMDDAARIDGCSFLGVFWRIILPLIKPALVTVAIFSFMFAWNDFLGPVIFLRSLEKQTLAVGIHFVNATASPARRPVITVVMAVSTLMIIPPTLVFFALQRYFIQGVVVTGIK